MRILERIKMNFRSISQNDLTLRAILSVSYSDENKNLTNWNIMGLSAGLTFWYLSWIKTGHRINFSRKQ